MGSTSARALEMAPPRRDAPGEDARGRAEESNGPRKASEAVAVVSAAVLAGGGAGMLDGIWLGAINPFALGLFGAAVGACVPALLVRRPWRRGAREAPGG
jgi:hypothetical protein